MSLNSSNAVRTFVRRTAQVTTLVASAAVGFPVAAAHSGTTHAGTPHWLLLLFVITGLGVLGLSSMGVRRAWVVGRVGIVGVFLGGLLAMFGGIGLVEIQVVAPAGPSRGFYRWYPLASLFIGSITLVGSFVIVRLRWPDRPRYAMLGGLLGAWISYPVVLPNNGVTNPIGYLLVLSVVLLTGYIIRHDAKPLLSRLRTSRLVSGVGVLSGVLFMIFFAFSAGTLSTNPDAGIGMPETRTITTVMLADPLVSWPAVEFYFPSIPLSGFVSVGTVLLFGFIGSLVGLNAAFVANQWERASDTGSSSVFAGSLAASGATACCCCAPAMYGVVSAVMGVAASPIYWAFMDPTSPVGGTFFAVSVLLLTSSLVRSADEIACEPRRSID
ncbi:hypothetical protein [Haladaptatus caseinilyticus]|uniref:hypothetical protein n=1 Tax=Haladaptatus caseinilyticus TaxID=2993314 RepID=UPI00224A9E21|nr:hypothetical protein [Haladaptatus caseinilyticus]